MGTASETGRLALAVHALVALATGCGADAVAETESHPLVSRVCGNVQPIRISAQPGGVESVTMIGDDFNIVSAEQVDDENWTFASYAVDPCGDVPEHRFADLRASAAGEGWYACADGSLLWAQDIAAAPSMLPIVDSCSIRHTPAGLLVFDEPGHQLLLFATPAGAPRVVATGIDPEMEDRGMMWRFTYADDAVWYVTDDELLFRDALDGSPAALVDTETVSVRSTIRPDIFAWERRNDDAGWPYFETTLRVLSSDETVALPGSLRGVDFAGFVWTGGTNYASVYDLARRESVFFSSAGDPQVVRMDGASAYLHVDSPWQDFSDDLVRVDMATGEVAEHVERIGQRAEARPDPHSDGILVFVPDPSDERGYGTISRFDSSGLSTIAELVSPYHRVAADGSVLYLDDLLSESRSLWLRGPDGADALFASHATLPHSIWIPLFGIDFGVRQAELQGDLIYSVHDGPDRGMWRMPFDTPEMP